MADEERSAHGQDTVRIRGRHAYVRGLRVLLHDRTAVAGLLIGGSLGVVAFLSPWLPLADPAAQNVVMRLQPPSSTSPFGTDAFGRDVLSRTLWGTRTSLLVGIWAVVIGGTVGTGLGLAAGYLEGRIDAIVSLLTNALLSFPTLILGLMVVAALGVGERKVVVAIAISFVPVFTRLARGATISVKLRDYVQSCRALGASQPRIMIRHIFPNIAGELTVTATLSLASAMMIETGLSFLGLGAQPPTATLGVMIRDAMANFFEAQWLVLFPALMLVVLVLSLNMAGDGVRDALDPVHYM